MINFCPNQVNNFAMTTFVVYAFTLFPTIIISIVSLIPWASSRFELSIYKIKIAETNPSKTSLYNCVL